MMVSTQNQRSLAIWKDFHDDVLTSIANFRNEDQFFDVTIFAQERSFSAHKLILAASSGLLRQIFLASPDKVINVVKLKNIDPLYFESALDFMYKGEVELAESQLPKFLAVAKTLQLTGLTGALKNRKSVRKSTNFAQQLPKIVTKRSVSRSIPQNPPTVIEKRPKIAAEEEEVPIKSEIPTPSTNPLTLESIIMSEVPEIWNTEGGQNSTDLENPESDTAESNEEGDIDHPKTKIVETPPVETEEEVAPSTAEPPLEEVAPPPEEISPPPEEIAPPPEEVAPPMTEEERDKAEKKAYYDSIYRQGPEIGPNGLSGELMIEYIPVLLPARFMVVQ